MVLILCKDLFFTSQLRAAVERAGLPPVTKLGMQDCLDALATGRAAWLIVDLGLEDLDLDALKDACPPGCRTIAFAPHVHEHRLQAATAAGYSFVLSRGQISQRLESILQSQ